MLNLHAEATPSTSSEEGDKERFVKVMREGEALRRTREVPPPETGLHTGTPVWHAALLDGLHTIQRTLVAP